MHKNIHASRKSKANNSCYQQKTQFNQLLMSGQHKLQTNNIRNKWALKKIQPGHLYLKKIQPGHLYLKKNQPGHLYLKKIQPGHLTTPFLFEKNFRPPFLGKLPMRCFSANGASFKLFSWNQDEETQCQNH